MTFSRNKNNQQCISTSENRIDWGTHVSYFYIIILFHSIFCIKIVLSGMKTLHFKVKFS